MRTFDLIGAHGAWRMAATMHRPSDVGGLAAAARQLASTGLTARDIASTLGLTEHGVVELLSSPLDFTLTPAGIKPQA